MPRITGYESFDDMSLFIITNHNKYNYHQTIGEKNFSLALFDLDDTITNLDPSFSKKPRFIHSNTIERMQELHDLGYFIGILSNQMDIYQKQGMTKKIVWIMKQTNVPMIFIAATGRDNFRKPAPGMFNYIVEKFFSNNFNRISLKKSFYVGDAAGRSFNGTKKDHSDCDIKFAINSGLHFFTPEDFFNQKIEIILKDLNNTFAKYKITTFNPKKIQNSYELPKFDNNIKNQKRVIFIYGKDRFSGKTYFSNLHFKEGEIFRTTATKSSHMLNQLKERIFGVDIDFNKPLIVFDCQEVSFIKKLSNSSNFHIEIYFLEYGDDIIRYLKVFSVLNDKMSLSNIKKTGYSEAKEFFKRQNIKFQIVPFDYNDSLYTENMKKMSEYIL